MTEFSESDILDIIRNNLEVDISTSYDSFYEKATIKVSIWVNGMKCAEASDTLSIPKTESKSYY